MSAYRLIADDLVLAAHDTNRAKALARLERAESLLVEEAGAGRLNGDEVRLLKRSAATVRKRLASPARLLGGSAAMFAVLLAMPALAQTPQTHPIGQPSLYRWSVFSLAAGEAADYASSIGQYEANPLARRPDGIFAPRRGALLKLAKVGGILLAERLLLRRYPRERRWFAKLNFAVGGASAGLAARNWRMEGRR